MVARETSKAGDFTSMLINSRSARVVSGLNLQPLAGPLYRVESLDVHPSLLQAVAEPLSSGMRLMRWEEQRWLNGWTELRHAFSRLLRAGRG